MDLRICVALALSGCVALSGCSKVETPVEKRPSVRQQSTEPTASTPVSRTATPIVDPEGERTLIPWRPVPAEVAAAAERYGPMPEDVRGQAKRIVGRFSGRFRKVERRAPMEGRVEYRDDVHYFDVITRTGDVWNYHFGGRQRWNGRDAGPERILAAARQQLARTYSAKRMPRMFERVLSGPHDHEYTVRFQERLGEVETPNHAELVYLADGRLVSQVQRDQDVTIDLEPRITKEQAIAKVGVPLHLVVAETKLVVWGIPAKAGQVLAWYVLMVPKNGAEGYAFTYVSAANGHLFGSAEAFALDTFAEER